jgi:Nif-specific regulatory protein
MMFKLLIHKNMHFQEEKCFSDIPNNFITIGRTANNDIILESPEVSRLHAMIYLQDDGQYILTDKSSRNFTMVADEPISQYSLSHGTTFQIADYLLTFLKNSKSQKKPEKVRISNQIPIREDFSQDSRTVLTTAKKMSEAPGAHQDPNKRLSIILSLSNQLVQIIDYNELVQKILDICMQTLDAERGFLALINHQEELVFSGLKGFSGDSGNLRISKTMIDTVLKEGRSILTSNAVMEKAYKSSKSVIAYQLKSVICAPLRFHDDVKGCIYFDNPSKEARFRQEDLEFLTILSHQIAIALENAALHKQVIEEKEKILNETYQARSNFIFTSKKMVQLYQDIQKVAATNHAVLILGETGTGKEVAARTVHDLSKRNGAFVPVNCAGIPENLLESELFGYRKGAFTSAINDKPGRFVLADGGTLFLDEIGDMSLALQAKLLRAIQEKEAVPLGGTKPEKFDVRIVSATNKNLKEMITKGEFREDLYYRINTLVLTTPPLRERKEDIPVLANYFLQKYNQEDGKSVSRISNEAMDIMINYAWPGNFRELMKNIINGVVFGDGRTIYPEDLCRELQEVEPSITYFPSLEDIEKRHIVKALQKVKFKNKAADLLGIARDTLYKKIEKYEIDAEGFTDF